MQTMTSCPHTATRVWSRFHTFSRLFARYLDSLDSIEGKENMASQLSKWESEDGNQRNVPTRVREVQIDGLAVLKIVKHCDENLPTMVAGSLLGLDVNGVLEVTYAYPFPAPTKSSDSERGEGNTEAELDGGEYQIEMMRMLRDVNVDNNCVGWYQSMYLGTMCTNEVVDSQYSYQSSEELSDNCVVIMYDPIRSTKGNLVLKAYHLSEEYLHVRRHRSNEFIRPSDILVELPLKIKNSGHVSAFLRCLEDSHKNELDCDFDPLSMAGGESQTEKHLDLLSNWMDELMDEQRRFQQYSKIAAKPRQDYVRWINKRVSENKERREQGEQEYSLSFDHSGLKPMPDAPPRVEPLLMIGQLDRYCKQMNEHVDNSFHKLIMASQLNASV